MKNNSRIRFNPVAKEIEIEGSESFVKTTLDRLLVMISGPAQKTVTIKRQPKAVKAAPEKKAEKPRMAKAPRVSKAKKTPKAVKPTIAKRVKKTGKKITNIDAVVGLIHGAPEGISTAELKTKTGLNERQIWSIVNRASKEGKIRKVKRGVYGGAASSSQK